MALYEYHRVLLPDWVFESEHDRETILKAKSYLQRYPDYLFVRVEGRYAICEKR